MSKVKRLIQSYTSFISTPWRDDAAASQRIIFCIYNENDELKLCAKIDEFEIATKQAGHEWALFDLTDSFAQWLATQRYAKSYFEKPQLLGNRLPTYHPYLLDRFKVFLSEIDVSDNTVVALKGVGSLFGFIKVKDLVESFAPLVPGRLIVFFPGTCENNNYRLLDGYDGWNYLAVPITADKEY